MSDVDACVGVNSSSSATLESGASEAASSGSGLDRDRKNGARKSKKEDDKKLTKTLKARITSLAQPKEPTFCIFGANGNAL